MQAKKYLIVVGGATASGKTSTAIALAQHFQTVILSADSRQFYREMSIGTAQPAPEELAQVPHYFINSHSIKDSYSVGAYEAEAMACLRRLFQEKDVVVLAGGSGLYINALCQGLDHFPAIPPDVRQYYEDKWSNEGLEPLQQELRTVDPAYAQRVDMQNPHRLIRALAVYRASGLPFSAFHQKTRQERFFTPVYLQMDWPRTLLYERINQRVDQMIAAGLEAEAYALRAYRAHGALATVGYQEWWPYFASTRDLATVIELIKRNSRRYAKRQLTWMRRDGFWRHFSPLQLAAIIAYTDWRISSGYELRSQSLVNRQELSYQQGERAMASLQITEQERFIWAQADQSIDTEALADLIREYGQRARSLPHWLVLPEGCELSVQQMGFQEAGEAQKVPVSLQQKLRTTDSLYLKQPEK